MKAGKRCPACGQRPHRCHCTEKEISMSREMEEMRRQETFHSNRAYRDGGIAALDSVVASLKDITVLDNESRTRILAIVFRVYDRFLRIRP